MASVAAREQLLCRALPEAGRPTAELLEELERRKVGDWAWREGRSFSLVYHLDDRHAEALARAHAAMAGANAVSAHAFPSVAGMEAEIVAMAADLLGGDGGSAGAVTSGGTEGILLAVNACRDGWRRRSRRRPQIVLPASAHPAFLQAAACFDLDPVVVPCGAGQRADVGAIEAALTDATAMLVGSAPSLPHGVADPVPELGRLAQRRDLWLHVDASLGSFVLPFLAEAGEDVTPFDLSVPGVTSLSVGLHKYGYAPKGTSVVLYRDAAARRDQLFATVEWPMAGFASVGLVGTRPGAAIAAAWVGLLRLGRAGYREAALRVVRIARELMAGIERIPGLRIVGKPAMSVFAFRSTDRDVFRIADLMEQRGWQLDRQLAPASIRLVVTPVHEPVVEPFLADLAAATAAAGRSRTRSAAPALYGGAGDGFPPGHGDPAERLLDGLEARWRR